MSARMDLEYLERQTQNRKQLVREGVKGETVRDILPNTSYALHEMSEAMYFKNARDFLKTTLAHAIIDARQDVFRRM